MCIQGKSETYGGFFRKKIPRARAMSSTKAVFVLSLLIIATTWSLRAPYVPKMHEANAPKDALRDPCCYEMQQRSPAVFTMRWETTYGPFSATCERARAPVWVDRIWNLARLGYYDDNFFLRVIFSERLKIVQFGTNGDPSVSSVYQYTHTTSKCAILEPQPPDMAYCMAEPAIEPDPMYDCTAPGLKGLSNTFGTLAMSTSSTITPKYPNGVTWNVTAELFINTGNNTRLDPLLFVPVCTIDEVGMEAVLRFPSFGELSELGGPGPSLDRLYAEGNTYIESNSSWSKMAKSHAVRVHEGVEAGDSQGHSAAAAAGPRHPLSEGGAETMQRRAVHARSPVSV